MSFRIWNHARRRYLFFSFFFGKVHSFLPYLQWRHAFPRNTCFLQTSQKENLNTRVLSNLENKIFLSPSFFLFYSLHWEKRRCSSREREREKKMYFLNKIEIGLTCIHCIWYRERRSFLNTHYMLRVLWDYSTWEKERYCSCCFDFRMITKLNNTNTVIITTTSIIIIN
jgi:hypothetical protein